MSKIIWPKYEEIFTLPIVNPMDEGEMVRKFARYPWWTIEGKAYPWRWKKRDSLPASQEVMLIPCDSYWDRIAQVQEAIRSSVKRPVFFDGRLLPAFWLMHNDHFRSDIGVPDHSWADQRGTLSFPIVCRLWEGEKWELRFWSHDDERLKRVSWLVGIGK